MYIIEYCIEDGTLREDRCPDLETAQEIAKELRERYDYVAIRFDETR